MLELFLHSDTYFCRKYSTHCDMCIGVFLRMRDVHENILRDMCIGVFLRMRDVHENILRDMCIGVFLRMRDVHENILKILTFVV